MQFFYFSTERNFLTRVSIEWPPYLLFPCPSPSPFLPICLGSSQLLSPGIVVFPCVWLHSNGTVTVHCRSPEHYTSYTRTRRHHWKRISSRVWLSVIYFSKWMCFPCCLYYMNEILVLYETISKSHVPSYIKFYWKIHSNIETMQKNNFVTFQWR